MATDTRIVDPDDKYADPPRNWKRVGGIAGSMVVLWTVVGLLVWLILAVPALRPTDERQGGNDSAENAVDAFFGQVYGRGDGMTPEFLYLHDGSCGGGDARTPPPDAVRRHRDELETAFGTVKPTMTGRSESKNGDTTTYGVTVDLGYASTIQTSTWLFTLVEDGGWWICGYTQTVTYEVPIPAPSTS